jgi:dienelactone hydrolase
VVSTQQFFRAIAFAFFAFTMTGCARLGPLGGGRGAVLSGDAAAMSTDDAERLGLPGPHDVEADRRTFAFPPGDFDIVVYRPVGISAPAPAVVFLPGRFAPEEQYESYARFLASRGHVVVMRTRYGWFHPDARLADEAVALERWLSTVPYVDPQRIGVAGHSMGGRDAIIAAVNDENFRAVVSIDPGGERSVPVIDHVIGKLRAPLLLIGAEVAWKGWDICAPRATNYEKYFERAPVGTVELTILGADHVQLMDDPDAFGQWICRVGTADSRVVRSYARRATSQFFEQHLSGTPQAPFENDRHATVRVRELPLPTAVSPEEQRKNHPEG